MSLELGPRILIFTGDGKGKTTAALGMALRAAGHGLPVCIVQFIKQDPSVGEIAAIRDAARLPNVEILQMGRGFVPKSANGQLAEHRAAAVEGLRQAGERIASGRFAMVILDEICVAVARGLLDEKAVIEVLGRAGPEMCLVLTGRQATPRLIDLADTVTEMRCIKHGYQAGRRAQKGVEL